MADSYSILGMSKLLGIDRTRMTRICAELAPIAETKREKRYSLPEVIDALLADERSKAASGGRGGARERVYIADASLKELKLGQQQGQLLPRDEVKEMLFGIFKHLHQQLTTALPTEVAAGAAGKKPSEIGELVRREVGAILNELRDADRTGLFGSAEGSDSDDEPDDERVGG